MLPLTAADTAFAVAFAAVCAAVSITVSTVDDVGVMLSLPRRHAAAESHSCLPVIRTVMATAAVIVAANVTVPVPVPAAIQPQQLLLAAS